MTTRDVSRSKVLFVLLLSGGVMTTACSPSYLYLPQTPAAQQITGQATADYLIPPQAPEGHVQVRSSGVVDATAKELEAAGASPAARAAHAPGEAKARRGIHLRLVLIDNGAKPWTFDAREQRIDFAGRAGIAPAIAASADAGAKTSSTEPGVMTVAPNEKRTVDLFFPLPEGPDGVLDAGDVPQFDALWRVTTAAGPYAERTAFTRATVSPGPAYGGFNGGPGYDWGAPYYFDPYDFRAYNGGLSGARFYAAPPVAGPAPVIAH